MEKLTKNINTEDDCKSIIKKDVGIINKILSNISINFIRILFAIIIIGMLFINSVYLYDDSPCFKMNNIYNYLSILANLFIVIIFCLLDKIISRKCSKSKLKISITISISFLLYFILEIIYIKLVPIVPFSDMGSVVKIAISNFSEGIEYLQSYPNNLPIAILFNLIFRITSYNFEVLKIFNVLCNMITIYFAYKIYNNIYKKENKLPLFLGIISISQFLYINCLYNDICFTTLITIILYLVTKSKKNRFDIIIISLLSFLQFKIRAVGIILVIALVMYYILKQRGYKNALILLTTFIILNFIYIPIQNTIIPKSENKPYPIWSFIQMGLNEKEFGFQDSSHSTDWTYQDVNNRIKELGPKRLVILLVKKHFWMWSEGTYQVERYAFGEGIPEEYYYENSVVKEISDVNNSKLRNGLEYFMKGQFWIILVLSFIEILTKEEEEYKNNQRELMLCFIIGIFCFYTVWEMKSRYIYSLYPIFLILASNGVNKLSDLIKNKINKRNIKINLEKRD